MADSPMPFALRFLAGPVSGIYRRIIEARNAQFDAGQGVVELDRPVISVGNLSVGGTGKTPAVRAIARTLLESGHRPVIAMRGYGKGSGESDEAEEYRLELPDVPVVAQADRLSGLLHHFATPRGESTDCVVLDDGFQHRRIARTADIVLLDATRDPFKDRLLPRGWLREPVSSLKRASFAIITHAERAQPTDVRAMQQAVREINSGIGVAVCRHAWMALRVHDREGEREEPVSWLKGKAALGVCGIGNPQAFLSSVREHTGSAPAEFIRPDHDPFDRSTIRKLLSVAAVKSGVIVTTGKDWVKLRRVRSDAWPCPVAVPRLELRFDVGWEDLKRHVLDAGGSGGDDESSEE
ncbi:MAG: tetraacyldisaccharide 4'-kinase [Planctomycetes bacterium]|nr:tetraacyldisaccharide 4'-kinase [Planctomycetota bacterium]